MKTEKNQNILVFTDKPFKYRIPAFFILFLGIGFVAFSRQLMRYFASPDLASQIVLTAVFVIIGLFLGVAGLIVLKIPAKTLVLNSTLCKIFYEKKYLFSGIKDEFAFSDVDQITQETVSLENGDFYNCYIVIRGGRQIEIPSETSTDKTKQDTLCQQVKDYIGV